MKGEIQSHKGEPRSKDHIVGPVNFAIPSVNVIMCAPQIACCDDEIVKNISSTKNITT